MAEDVISCGFCGLIGTVDAGREYSGKGVLGKNRWHCTENIIDCHPIIQSICLLNPSHLHKNPPFQKQRPLSTSFVASPPHHQPSHQPSQRTIPPLNNCTHKHHNSPSHTPTPASESPTRTGYRCCTSTTAHSHPASPASTISRPSGILSSSSPWCSRSRHRSSRRGRLGCWYPWVWLC